MPLVLPAPVSPEMEKVAVELVARPAKVREIQHDLPAIGHNPPLWIAHKTVPIREEKQAARHSVEGPADGQKEAFVQALGTRCSTSGDDQRERKRGRIG